MSFEVMLLIMLLITTTGMLIFAAWDKRVDKMFGRKKTIFRLLGLFIVSSIVLLISLDSLLLQRIPVLVFSPLLFISISLGYFAFTKFDDFLESLLKKGKPHESDST